jgi:hypothetical protein
MGPVAALSSLLAAACSLAVVGLVANPVLLHPCGRSGVLIPSSLIFRAQRTISASESSSYRFSITPLLMGSGGHGQSIPSGATALFSF